MQRPIYELRRDELVPLSATYPKPKVTMPAPRDFSEECLHHHAAECRRMEVEAPDVTNYPIGTWAINRLDSLSQLREIPISQIDCHENPNHRTVAKYVDWYKAGNPFPPVYIVEDNRQVLSLTDGHHRIAAMKHLGISHTKAWVSPSLYRKLDNGSLWADDFDYAAVVLLALRMGINVNNAVLRDALIPRFRKAMDYLKKERRFVFTLSGFEGILFPTEIELFRRWKLLAGIQHSRKGYHLCKTPLTHLVLIKLEDALV